MHLLRTTERVQTLHLRDATNYSASMKPSNQAAYSARDGIPDVSGALTNQRASAIINRAALIVMKYCLEV